MRKKEMTSDFVSTERFAKHFAEYCGTRYALGVANGQDALKLIIRAHGFGAGDEIIVPSNTYIATVLAVSENGCTPVLVEPDIHTYNIDPDKIEAAIAPKTKAIIVTHLYGQAVQMKKIWELSMMYGLKVFEDCSEAHGALYQGVRAGNLAHAGVFSFCPGKNLDCAGDGGAVVTNDEYLCQRVKVLAKYSRLDELQAAVLDVKLPHLDADNARRREIAAYYRKNITNPLIILPETYDENAAVWHVFAVRTQERDRFQQYLTDNGVQTIIHYPTPPHKQLAYTEWNNRSYPVAEEICRTVVSLPISPVLTDEEVRQVTEVVNAYR
ncbi:MAG: DegT/DnrJ/EryC1/StrS family aminotransferase [Alphaproteobacteria bacterium]|nr:DegT/DnrJ/EryC1/StrS family aminotransferase [Alphaproteobacteria bacterium]